MRLAMKDFEEIMSVELISVTIGLVAGTVLALAAGDIETIPGLLIIIPGFLEMRGNISGTLSSRLTSGLYINTVKPHFTKNRIVKGNVYASMLLVVAVSFFLGIVAVAFTYLTLGIVVMKLMIIAVIAGIISNFIEVPMTVLMTFWLFRHGHDPNNIMGPYVTSTGDVTSIISLVIAIFLVTL